MLLKFISSCYEGCCWRHWLQIEGRRWCHWLQIEGRHWCDWLQIEGRLWCHWLQIEGRHWCHRLQGRQWCHFALQSVTPMFQKSDEFFGTYTVLRGSKSFTYQKFLISKWVPWDVYRKWFKLISSAAWKSLLDSLLLKAFSYCKWQTKFSKLGKVSKTSRGGGVARF